MSQLKITVVKKLNTNDLFGNNSPHFIKWSDKQLTPLPVTPPLPKREAAYGGGSERGRAMLTY